MTRHTRIFPRWINHLPPMPTGFVTRVGHKPCPAHDASYGIIHCYHVIFWRSTRAYGALQYGPVSMRQPFRSGLPAATAIKPSWAA